MYTLNDRSQFQAMAIEAGKHKLSGVHQELMEWITKQFGVRALDFYCEKRETSKAQQLIHVILDTVEDVKKIQANQADKAMIVERFLKYLKSTDSESHILDPLKGNVFPADTNPYPETIVTYRPLKGIGEKILREMLFEERGEILKAFESVWTVSQYVVFYYTDAQIKENEANGTSTKVIEELERIDKKYGFSQSIPYRFDSKEYFDGACEGKWHYYWK